MDSPGSGRRNQHKSAHGKATRRPRRIRSPARRQVASCWPGHFTLRDQYLATTPARGPVYFRQYHQPACAALAQTRRQSPRRRHRGGPPTWSALAHRITRCAGSGSAAPADIMCASRNTATNGTGEGSGAPWASPPGADAPGRRLSACSFCSSSRPTAPSMTAGPGTGDRHCVRAERHT